jgi:hypothetical protein
MTYLINITYIEGYGDGYFERDYRISGENLTDILDSALTQFLTEFGEELDDVIDNLEFSYRPV